MKDKENWDDKNSLRWLWKEFMTEFPDPDPEGQVKDDWVKLFLQTLSLQPKITKTYRLKTLAGSLKLVLGELWPKGHTFPQRIRLLIESHFRPLARELCMESLQAPKQAKSPDFDSQVPLWNVMRQSHIKVSKQAGLASMFSFISGRRIGELFILFIEDKQIISNPTGRTLLFPIRYTKSDPYGLMYHQISIPLPANPKIDTEAWLNDVIGSRTEGILFNELTHSKYLHHMKKYSKLAEVPCTTGHSGRISFVKTGVAHGVPIEKLRRTCGWSSTSQMPDYYCRKTLESTQHGAPWMMAHRLTNDPPVPSMNQDEPSSSQHCNCNKRKRLYM